MHVFDIYDFNIAEKVKFADTKPYLDKKLAETGHSYTGIAFTLYDMKDDARQKAVEMFPNLRKYAFLDKALRQYGLTSYKSNWAESNIYTDKADWNEISELFSKIPHKLNFSSGNMMYSGVNWFKDSTDEIAPDYMFANRCMTSNIPPFLSNRIIHYRFLDDGKKTNSVSVCIDVTDEPQPRDSREIIAKLESYLGKPTDFKRRCMFSEEEDERFNGLMHIENKYLVELMKTTLPKSKESEPLVVPNIMPPPEPVIEHVADKLTLDKAFADTGFTRQKGQPNLHHMYECIDEHGFLYEAYTQKLSYGNNFRIRASISGHNFAVGTGNMDYYVTEEGESLEILKQFAAFCVQLREEYSARLAEKFGDTPKWYNVR